MVKITPDYVWCDVHGEIHERRSDPYSDLRECGPSEWREVIVGQPLEVKKRQRRKKK